MATCLAPVHRSRSTFLATRLARRGVPGPAGALLLLLTVGGAHAQNVTVSGANSGNGGYSTLAAAVSGIGTTGQGGADVVVTIHADLTAGATINQGDWSSLTILPDGARSITATVNGNALIDLNGADRVTIDGLGTGGNSLTISNTSTSSTANTSTIRFINDASDNTVANCTVLGASAGVPATLNATVLFAGTTGTTGNDGNTISNCAIADGAATPSKAILSVGSTSSLAHHNSGNRIEGCDILNFFLPGGSRGFQLGAGNHQWTIAGNKFYQEDPRTTAANGSQHHVIDVTGGSDAYAGGHAIEGNTIGFANASGTGTWTLSGGTNLFRAIRVDLPNTAPRGSIKGNTIAGIAHATSAGGTGASSPSTMVHVLGGPVDVDSNTIGRQDTIGSIVFMPSTTGRHFHAILNSGSDDWATRHNAMGGILFDGSGGLYGMRSTVAGAWQCDSNLVGGTLANSIRMSGTGAGGVLHGISSTGATVSATGNTVRNLGSAGTSTALVHGIHAAGGSLMAAGDTITGLQCTAGTRGIVAEGAPLTAVGNTIAAIGGGSATGISATGAPATVAGNTIEGLTGNTTGTMHGILMVDDSLTATGNTVRDIANASTGSNARAAGVQATDGTLIATGNTVLRIAAFKVDGINATRSRLLAEGNTIDSLASIGTASNHHTFVNGIVIDGDSATVHGNTITRVGNGSVSSLARARGMLATDAVLTATDNTISDFASTARIEGISADGSRVTVAGNTIAGLTSARIDGILATGTRLTATGNAITGLSGTVNAANTTVHGISITGDTLTAAGNTITDLDNPTTGSGGRARGIHAVNAVLTATGNAIHGLTAVHVDGISASGAPLTATGNTITGLGGTGAADHGIVNGISLSDDTAMVAGNTVRELSNTATTSLARMRGVYATGAVLTATHNTISGFTGTTRIEGISAANSKVTASGNTIANLNNARIDGILATDTRLTATGNTITGLAGTVNTANTTVHGISVTGDTLTAIGNTISGLSNPSTGGASGARGISATDATVTATGNTIANVSGDGPGVAGIAVNNTAGKPLVTLRSNTIHTLHSAHATNNGEVHGIWAALRDTANVIERNLVHSLWRNSSGTGSTLRGIHLAAGTGTVGNNMVRLGIDSAGNSVGSAHVFQGIHVAGGEHAVLHNSVHIGGTVTTSTSTNHTYALLSAVTGARDYRNNILVNARTNGTGTAKHYSIGVNSSLTGLVSGHNCLYVSGTGGHVGREGTTDRTTLSAWQGATGQDANSISTAPGFVDPTGDAASVDLHIAHNSAGALALSGAGDATTGITNDFDDNLRQNPPDIGADEFLRVFPDFFEEDLDNNMTYWENKGQVVDTDLSPRPDVKFYSERGFPMAYLRGGSVVSYTTYSKGDSAVADTTWRVDVRPIGGKARAVDPMALERREGHRNFYFPWCGPNGATEVRGYGRVVYQDIYPKVDMHFHSGSSGLRMAYVVRPGGDYQDIHLEFTGQDSLTVDSLGMLVAHLSGRSFTMAGGIAYQVDGGGGIVPLGMTTYLNSAGSPVVDFGMSLMGYDPDLPLVIQVGWPPGMGGGSGDPRNMLWSTYAGSNSGDEFMATDVDANGDVYATGYTYQANFPVNTGYQVFPAFEPNFAGSEDVVTMKFRSTNKQILWATFQGGSGSSTSTVDEWRGLDKGYDMAVYRGEDTSLEYVFVTGATVNTDFFTWVEPGTPFANADLTPFSGGLVGQEHAAFILAYTQFDGRLHWSTTLGPGQGDIWCADGLGVDVLDDGTLVWAGRTSPVGAAGSFSYPFVTPTGAFTRPQGGGFFVLFDSDYRIEWNTFFGSTCGESGVFDVKLARLGQDNHRKAFITGVTCPPNPPTLPGLDVYQPPGGIGFFQPAFGGGARDAYFAVLNMDTYQLEYSTHWGGNGTDIGIALEVVATAPHNARQVWVGGLSKSTDLDNTLLPPPGTGGLHQTANAGDADAFLLCFSTTPEVDLVYGTLYGGPGSDAILGLEAGKDGGNPFGAPHIYATGETSSATGIVLTQNPALYLQDQLGNDPGSTALDAFLLALHIQNKEPVWTTYLGGFNTDKGWGVAASENELYLVGGTVSDQATFPLKEFDPNAPQDWYDGDLLNNMGNGSLGHYTFNDRNFYRPFNSEVMQYEGWPGWAHDAFIASFGVSPTLSVPGQVSNGPALRPLLVDPEGLWSLPLPEGIRWLRVHDVTGRVLEERRTPPNEGRQPVDLRHRAPGVYVVTCGGAEGPVLSVKLFRP